jgi:hypothetical protein
VKKSEALEFVVKLVACFPNSRFTRANTEAYVTCLVDLDCDVATRALPRLAMVCGKFVPSVQDIREVVTDMQHGPRRTGAEAWQDVERAQRKAGYLRTPRFTDPIVASIVAADWATWCKPDNPAADRARFIELYEVRSKRARADLVSGVPLPPPQAPQRLSEGRPSPKALPHARWPAGLLRRLST